MSTVLNLKNNISSVSSYAMGHSFAKEGFSFMLFMMQHPRSRDIQTVITKAIITDYFR